MSPDLAQLEQRLSALTQAGAANWDAPGVQLVRRLLDAAQQADAALGAHVLRRAAVHLERLAQAFEANRAQAQQCLHDLSQRGLVEAASWQAKLDAGAIAQVRRLARRLRYCAPRVDPSLAARRAELEARATARGISSPGALESPSTQVLAATLYRDAVAGANASLTVARAVASVPEDAGHYNSMRVASRALEALSDYPPYLQAQLARLQVAGMLRELGGTGRKTTPNASQRGAKARKRS